MTVDELRERIKRLTDAVNKEAMSAKTTEDLTSLCVASGTKFSEYALRIEKLGPGGELLCDVEIFYCPDANCPSCPPEPINLGCPICDCQCPTCDAECPGCPPPDPDYGCPNCDAECPECPPPIDFDCPDCDAECPECPPTIDFDCPNCGS